MASHSPRLPRKKPILHISICNFVSRSISTLSTVPWSFILFLSRDHHFRWSRVGETFFSLFSCIFTCYIVHWPLYRSLFVFCLIYFNFAGTNTISNREKETKEGGLLRHHLIASATAVKSSVLLLRLFCHSSWLPRFQTVLNADTQVDCRDLQLRLTQTRTGSVL